MLPPLLLPFGAKLGVGDPRDDGRIGTVSQIRRSGRMIRHEVSPQIILHYKEVVPRYLYQTIPTDPNVDPEQFEVEQPMSDAALTVHPETGVPVERVITGGLGFISRSSSRDETVQCPSGPCELPREIAERAPCRGGDGGCGLA